jgi:cobalt-zinc-cadmium efflux system membrane fusion protein
VRSGLGHTLVFTTILFAALAGCKKPAPSTDAKPASSAHEDEKEHEGLPKRVHLGADVIAAAGIKTEPVKRDTLVMAIELAGEIASDPDRTADVSARMAGRLERVTFKEGGLVKAGELLAVVRAPEAGELSSTMQSLNARAMSARANASRLDALLKSGLASQQEVLAAKAEADALEAQARAAAERMRAMGGSASSGATLSLTSPIAGTVVARHAVVGQPVTADQTIATVVNLSEVWFLARVFEQNLARIRVGEPAEVQLNAYPNERFSGTIEYVAPRIDPAARTVVARIRLTNRNDMLRLGLFGTALIDSGEASKRTPTIVVPRSALTEVGGKTVVFVKHPDDDFELHDVVVGASALGRVEVIAGLREGEQLVVAGVFTLKSVVLKASLAEDD